MGLARPCSSKIKIAFNAGKSGTALGKAWGLPTREHTQEAVLELLSNNNLLFPGMQSGKFLARRIRHLRPT